MRWLCCGTPSAQQFLLWRIKPLIWFDVKLELLDKGTPQERLRLFMKSERMKLEGNTGFSVPDELKFLINGNMVIRRSKASDPSVAHVTGAVRLALEAEVPPDSPLQLLPVSVLTDSGTVLCETVLRSVAARMVQSMSTSYQKATTPAIV